MSSGPLGSSVGIPLIKTVMNPVQRKENPVKGEKNKWSF
jgi:hypothetical protein